MIKFVSFISRAIRGIVSSARRYVRLTPNSKGRVYFFDKKKKTIFDFKSRGEIDSITIDHVYTFESYEFENFKRWNDIHAKYNEILGKNRTPLIIDCGGNIGLASRFFADKFPSSEVIYIEPSRDNFQSAKYNCRGHENIRFEEAAIGSKGGNVEILNKDADPNAYRVSVSEDGSGIKMVSIDGLLESNDNYELFITKVDIEGFEEDLFSENTSWIDSCPLLIIELHDWMFPKKITSKNFLTEISRRDRDFILHGENVYSIRN